MELKFCYPGFSSILAPLNFTETKYFLLASIDKWELFLDIRDFTTLRYLYIILSFLFIVIQGKEISIM